ncbi:uncharacterized protein V3H82_004322, partial [Fundulus diaphanus]
DKLEAEGQFLNDVFSFKDSSSSDDDKKKKKKKDKKKKKKEDSSSNPSKSSDNSSDSDKENKEKDKKESPERDQSGEPKPEDSGSGVSSLSASVGGGSAQSDTRSSSVGAPSSTVKTDPPNPSSTYKSSYTSSHLRVGDRPSSHRSVSSMESLMGSPKRYGEGTTRTSATLSSSDLLRGPKPYQP